MGRRSSPHCWGWRVGETLKYVCGLCGEVSLTWAAAVGGRARVLPGAFKPACLVWALPSHSKIMSFFLFRGQQCARSSFARARGCLQVFATGRGGLQKAQGHEPVGGFMSEIASSLEAVATWQIPGVVGQQQMRCWVAASLRSRCICKVLPPPPQGMWCPRGSGAPGAHRAHCSHP